jgi:hypothetical protein
MLAREGVQFVMRSRENAHQPSVHEQRDSHFGERGLLTGDVIGVLPHIGRVAHLQGGCDVTHHALLAHFQARSLAVKRAAMDAGHLQLATLFVVQIDGCFHTAKCRGHVVNNFGDQFIKVENGRNLLRPFLQFEQMLDLIELHWTNRDRVRNKRSWACGHRIQLP